MPGHHLAIGAVTESKDHVHHQTRLMAGSDGTGINPQVSMDAQPLRGLLSGNARGVVQARIVGPPDSPVR
jgi:hypothetical protein